MYLFGNLFTIDSLFDGSPKSLSETCLYLVKLTPASPRMAPELNKFGQGSDAVVAN